MTNLELLLEGRNLIDKVHHTKKSEDYYDVPKNRKLVIDLQLLGFESIHAFMLFNRQMSIADMDRCLIWKTPCNLCVGKPYIACVGANGDNCFYKDNSDNGQHPIVWDSQKCYDWLLFAVNYKEDRITEDMASSSKLAEVKKHTETVGHTNSLADKLFDLYLHAPLSKVGVKGVHNIMTLGCSVENELIADYAFDPRWELQLIWDKPKKEHTPHSDLKPKPKGDTP